MTKIAERLIKLNLGHNGFTTLEQRNKVYEVMGVSENSTREDLFNAIDIIVSDLKEVYMSSDYEGDVRTQAMRSVSSAKYSINCLLYKKGYEVF